MDTLIYIIRLYIEPNHIYFPDKPEFILETLYVLFYAFQLLFLLLKFECIEILHDEIVKEPPEKENIYYCEDDSLDIRVVPRDVKQLKDMCEDQMCEGPIETAVFKPLFPTEQKSLAALWKSIIDRKLSKCTLKSQIESTKEYILLSMCSKSPYEIRTDQKFRAPKQVIEMLNKYSIEELLGKPMLSHFLQMQIDCVVRRRNNVEISNLYKSFNRSDIELDLIEN